MTGLSVEPNFTFEGFDPSSDLKSYCKQIFCYVEDRSPCQSVKIASVVKVGDNYKGLIRVVSPAGTFLVSSANKKPDHLIDDLYSQFSQQIYQRMSERFV